MAADGLKKLRKRAETVLKTPAAQAVPAAIVARHLRRAIAGTTWRCDGTEAIAEECRAGAVILCAWHGRLLGLPRFWDTAWGPLTTLTSMQYPGRLAGQAFRRFGFPTQPMHDTKGSQGASLPLARDVRRGMSLGIATDGPLGPNRVAKSIPLDWSRLTGAPVWCVGFSTTRHWRLSSWDALLVPRAGGTGAFVFRRFGVMDRRAEPGAALARLQATLDDATDAADQLAGHAAPLG